MEDYETPAAEPIEGSSTKSIQDAVRNALETNPRNTNHRLLTVGSVTVEEGGIVPDITFRVTAEPAAPAPRTSGVSPKSRRRDHLWR
jgi:hypothetical protein